MRPKLWRKTSRVDPKGDRIQEIRPSFKEPQKKSAPQHKLPRHVIKQIELYKQCKDEFEFSEPVYLKLSDEIRRQTVGGTFVGDPELVEKRDKILCTMQKASKTMNKIGRNAMYCNFVVE